MLAPAPGPRAHADAFVELQKVTHTYGRGDKEVRALESTDLRIEKGDFIALVGPSGCGKSTILKLVTGLINASSGVVFVAGREVTAEPVRVGMAFQNPTLLPWLTLRDNVMLPATTMQARIVRQFSCAALKPQAVGLSTPARLRDNLTPSGRGQRQTRTRSRTDCN
jgi:ABC-type nitrate/sulfonate/bicarbonate transport system ATPase subunit